MLEHYVAFSLLAGIILGSPMMLLLVSIILMQTWTLSRRLDKHFFNTKHFSGQEMGMFDHFHWSVWKALGYIRFITFPNSLKRRFGNETALDKISTFDHLLARATMILLIVACVVIFNMAFAVIIFFAHSALAGKGA